MSTVVYENGIPTLVPDESELTSDQKLIGDLMRVALRDADFASAFTGTSSIYAWTWNFGKDLSYADPDREVIINRRVREAVMRWVRLLVQNGFGGGAQKMYSDNSVKYELTHRATGKKFLIMVERETLCKKVQVGEETKVVEEVEYVTRKVEKTVPVYEWDCS